MAAYFKGGQRHVLGVTEAIKTLSLVFRLMGAFLIAGYVRVLVPEEVVREWPGRRIRAQRGISRLFS